MSYFLPIASGSSGNCALYVAKHAKILIDAGTNTKVIRTALSEIGLELSEITHIFITHTHNDHISALPVLMKYTGAKLCVSSKAATEFSAAFQGAFAAFEYHEQVDAFDVCVKSFPTSHDSYGSVGFVVRDGNESLAYCTDLGFVSEEVATATKGVRTLYIESNHDLTMLKYGPYPRDLKRRILSDVGHISNEECAEFVTNCVKNGTKTVILAHLSEQNNRPDKALYETEKALYSAGADDTVRVHVAQKRNSKPPIHIL